MQTPFGLNQRAILTTCMLLLPSASVLSQRWDGYGGNQRNHTIERSAIPDSSAPALAWSVSLGHGRSGIVTDGTSIYTTFLKPFPTTDSIEKPSERAHVEVLASLDADTGREAWRFEYDAGFLEEQQTFSGRDRAPQSTPLLIEDPIAGPIVVSIGFTGKLQAISRDNGRCLWSIDLVEQLGATPVSFGFSSSPILVDDQLIVLAGGTPTDGNTDSNTDSGNPNRESGNRIPNKRGGLVSIRPSDGQVLWTVGCGEASYATPVLATFDRQPQIIFVTRRRVVSVSPTGKILWEKPLPKSGLTNVPTPLVVPNGLIVSGQGIGGTVRWNLERNGQKWKVTEAWFSDTPFFYCNWVLFNGNILGCSNKLLHLIDASTGITLGKWRGYADGNVAAYDNQVLVSHGDGSLSRLTTSENGFASRGSWTVLKQRCWTPPTFVDGKAFFRMGKSVHCMTWNHHDPHSTTPAAVTPLAPLQARKELRIKPESFTKNPSATPTQLAPLAEIQAMYDSDGVQAAIDVYHKTREANPSALDLDSRKKLQRLALQVGQDEFANQLPEHAFVDNPNDITKSWLLETAKKQLRSKTDNPENSSSVGKNGLRYLKFAIVNLGDRRDAVVKGPPQHPFGYGLPLRKGQVRFETWPVGTNLSDESTGETLLRITDKHAGQILVIQP